MQTDVTITVASAQTTEEDIQTNATNQMLETPPATPSEESPQDDDIQTIIHHDHSYTDSQDKPFNCNYCTFKSAHKYNRDKHQEICTARPETEIESEFVTEDMYKCRVCKKLYSYEKLRKHYRQFITSIPRKNRNGHDKVSKEIHELHLDELKLNK